LKLILKDNNEIREVEVDRSKDMLKIGYGDNLYELGFQSNDNTGFLLILEGRNVKGSAVRVKDHIYLHISGRHYVFEDVTEQDDAGIGGTSGGVVDNVIAPMPGSVIKVLVSEGEKVKQDQSLVIVEAMKMENAVHAPTDAVVKKILVTAGQQVGAGEVLIEFAEPDSDEETPPS